VTGVHAGVGVLVLVLNAACAAWGGWCWYRGIASPRFWPLLRGAQAVVLLEALIGVLLLVTGRHPANLHVLYGVLPAVVMFFAEQLRIGSADQVLDAWDLESAQEMRRLPEADQRAVVLAIVRRETGVMAAAALVALLLALRAVTTAGGL
jgi:hypothetical protein